MSTTDASRTHLLPLDRLDAHPANSNVMPRALMDKLSHEIRRTGFYPPLIVRSIGDRFQILDGHHRAAVLRELGHTEAQAVVWRADDEQALLLLATLNRLRGDDDPRKRAALLAELRKSIEVSELALRLPERREQIGRLLELHETPPAPRSPRPIDQMPVSLHFFLLPAQRRAVEERLRGQGGTREEALLNLLRIKEAADV